MIQTVEVEIDEAGRVHPIGSDVELPTGRALLTWATGHDMEAMLLAEPVLAVDWLRPEEDQAWSYMQEGK